MKNKIKTLFESYSRILSICILSVAAAFAINLAVETAYSCIYYDGICQSELGENEYNCEDCHISIPTPYCGDGLPDPGETCDDGTPPNGNPGYYCRINCTYCGDYILDPGEDCEYDDENCNEDCTLPPLDFGDAPDSYGTLLASNGPRHAISQLFLGPAIDADPDGQPTANADGDDTDFDGADEDGVVFLDPFVIGEWVEMDIIASAAGLLDAWVDFNMDGDFNDPGEQIFTNEHLLTGSNEADFEITGNISGYTYMRFRLSSDGDLNPTGPAHDGEVEDYKVFIELPPLFEGGDAPSSYNNSEENMYTYPNDTYASFPVTWGPNTEESSSGYGFCHYEKEHGGSYLGNGLSFELDADLLPDQDGLTNIYPEANLADRDRYDDGVIFPDEIIPCEENTVTVTGYAAELPLYINIWMDWDRDGDWDDDSIEAECSNGREQEANEWAYDDYEIEEEDLDENNRFNIEFNEVFLDDRDGPMWVRVTLSEEPVDSFDGGKSGGQNQGCFDDGETEDYYLCANDQDCDGVLDREDNCPTTYNPEQEDEDEDNVGDVCDLCQNESNWSVINVYDFADEAALTADDDHAFYSSQRGSPDDDYQLGQVNEFSFGECSGEPPKTFHIFTKEAGVWTKRYSRGFDFYYESNDFDLSSYLPDSDGEYKVKISHTDSVGAQIDEIKLNNQAPLSALLVEDGTDIKNKLESADHDVVSVGKKSIIARFNETNSSKLSLTMTAKEDTEEFLAANDPFLIPGTNQNFEYPLTKNKAIVLDGILDPQDKLSEIDEKLYIVPTSGHPSGEIYAYFNNDSENLYISLDITPDNTDDSEMDYVTVNINGESFKVSDNDETYGQLGFMYTDKVAYEHKVAEVAIPLSEINARLGDIVEFNIEVYGTLSIAAERYCQIAASDHPAPGEPVDFRYRALTEGAGSGNSNTQRFEFLVREDIANASQIRVHWEGLSLPAGEEHEATLYVWDNTKEEDNWVEIGNNFNEEDGVIEAFLFPQNHIVEINDGVFAIVLLVQGTRIYDEPVNAILTDYVKLETLVDDCAAGGRRARGGNDLVIQACSGPVNTDFPLISCIDEEAYPSNIRGLSFTSIEPPVDIFSNEEEGQAVSLESLLNQLSKLLNYLTAYLGGETETITYEATGDEAYFHPTEVGDYDFEITATFYDGPSVTQEFTANVYDQDLFDADLFGAADQPCAYKYYDFPGIERFNLEDASMICELEDIIKGLIPNEILGSYLNLVRSHSIIAAARTYQDNMSVYKLITAPKNNDSNFLDVSDDDPDKDTYEANAKGFALEEALVALDLFDFVSETDKRFLEQRVEELIAAGTPDSPSNRYLLPTSDIRKLDLLQFLDSVLGLGELFEINDILTLYQRLGIINDFENPLEGINRADSFSIYYRIQQLGHFLKERYDAYGLSDTALSYEEARIALGENLIEEYEGSLDKIAEELANRTNASIREFRNIWQDFSGRSDTPYGEINDIINNSTYPPEILERLKELLD